jgi:hypothetical protein
MVGHNGNPDKALARPKGLSQKEEEAIFAMLRHSSVEDAAADVNVGRTTLYRWLAEPKFAAAYSEVRDVMFGHAIARGKAAACRAVCVLDEIANNPEAEYGTRVNAARGLLAFVSNANIQVNVDSGGGDVDLRVVYVRQGIE